VLRPSETAARTSPDLLKIWGEELVIKDVPVVYETPWSPATTQP
jgi:hypothetical protein